MNIFNNVFKQFVDDSRTTDESSGEDNAVGNQSLTLNKPKLFRYDKNQNGEDWELWKKEFFIYLKLLQRHKKFIPGEESYILINLMSTEAIRALEKITFNDKSDKENLNILIQKFDEIFIPPINEVKERYKFFSRKKRDNETIECFIEDLKKKASRCNFGVKADNFILDVIILNAEKHLQQIFMQQDVTLSHIIEIYKYHSNKSKQIEEMIEKPSTSKHVKEVEHVDYNSCWRCGTNHPLRSCPAWGCRCSECNDQHHFTGRCPKYKFNKKYICSQRGTNRPYKQCPAHRERFCTCFETGHISSKCTQDVELVDVISIKKEEEVVDCQWCGLKHGLGRCQHDATCPMCDIYPHNICFQCRLNPHADDCIFKESLDLPRCKEAQDSSLFIDCMWCGIIHRVNQCPHDETCPACSHFPHNICFQCRTNPHEDLCIFKDIIVLPEIIAM